MLQRFEGDTNLPSGLSKLLSFSFFVKRVLACHAGLIPGLTREAEQRRVWLVLSSAQTRPHALSLV